MKMEDHYVCGEQINKTEEKYEIGEYKRRRGSTYSTNFSEGGLQNFAANDKTADLNKTQQISIYNFKKVQSTFDSFCENKENVELNTSLLKNGQMQKMKTDSKILSSNIAQLQDIERKTENLVLKEKEQRKQLKKLKKLYDAKLEEYQTLKGQYVSDSETFTFKLNEFENRQKIMQEEANTLKYKIQELEAEIKAIEDLLEKEKDEKNCLWKRIEVIEANCECRFCQNEDKDHLTNSRIEQLIQLNDDVDQLKNQIEILDKKIEEKHKSASSETDLKEIISLFEFRKNYNSKLEELIVERERKKSERVIFKLNRIIVNQNKKCFGDIVGRENSNLDCTNMAESVIYSSEEKDKAAQTSDSFFGELQDSKYNQTVETQSNVLQPFSKCSPQFTWSQLKIELSNLIEKSSLIGYEEIYENMQELVTGIMNLIEIDGQSLQYLNLVSIIMNRTNDFFQEKARKQCNAIDKLMQIVGSKVQYD